MSYPGAGEAAGEVRLRKPERRQMEWVPQCMDDLVAATHGVRTVAAKLDLSAFREPIKAREGVAGRDATDPELLVPLWLYGCIRGIGSARELARRCEESAPFRWLCGGVGVNHRMLSDFRTVHGEALDQLFTRFRLLHSPPQFLHVLLAFRQQPAQPLFASKTPPLPRSLARAPRPGSRGLPIPVPDPPAR